MRCPVCNRVLHPFIIEKDKSRDDVCYYCGRLYPYKLRRDIWYAKTLQEEIPKLCEYHGEHYYDVCPGCEILESPSYD